MTDPTSIFILDNGAYTIKANYSPYNDPYGLYTIQAESGPSRSKPKKKPAKKGKRGKKANVKTKEDDSMQVDLEEEIQPVDPYEPRVFQNCLIRTREKKVHFGADIDLIPDQSSLVYRRPFEKGLLTSWNPENLIWGDVFNRFRGFEPAGTSLLVTEPYLNPPGLGENYDQVVFEEWEFASYARSCGESCSRCPECLYDLCKQEALSVLCLVAISSLGIDHI